MALSRLEQFARLASEARAVMPDGQLVEMAISMDLESADVEALFNEAEKVYEAAKDRTAQVKTEHDVFKTSQRALANCAADFMHDFGAVLGTTIPMDFKRFAERLQVMQAVTSAFNDSKRRLEIAITVCQADQR